MRISFCIVLLLLCFPSFSQSKGTDYSVGKSFVEHSDIMGDEREIQIYLPDDYQDSGIEYPVLYILDGQRYFLHAVSLQKSFLDFKQTSAFIIVGMSKNKSDRNSIYSSKSEKYRTYIEEEVIAFIDENYRTTDQRILYGWAFGGGFVMESMINKPDLFEGYIAASPFPLENKIEDVDSVLAHNNNFDKMLFFTSETNGGSVIQGAQKLDTLLKNKAPESLNWTFTKLPSEEHRSTAYTSLYHGIRKYYQFYPELQFNNLIAFNEAGGLPYVYDYYNQRAKKYNFRADLSDWTMFSITRNAMRANDLKQFELFINEFKDTGFLKRLSINRAISIAHFYLDNNKYEEAERLFLTLEKLHPESAQPLEGLGDLYSAMNDRYNAALYYKKAKEKLK